MARSLRDRFFTPQVARAITSPGSILLLGAAGAAGILAGGLVWGAAAGLAAYAARVALAVPRDRREAPNPAALSTPWRDYVREVLDSQQRYGRVVASVPDGPLRDRLAEIGQRIEDGVAEAWRIAQRGHALAGGLAQLNVEQIRQQLAYAEAEARQAPRSPSRDRTIEALRAQLQTAERLAAITREAADRLRLLDARLDEAVARAVELSLSGDTGQLSGLGSDVDVLVGEMESLRQALEETSHGGSGTTQMGVA